MQRNRRAAEQEQQEAVASHGECVKEEERRVLGTVERRSIRDAAILG